MIKSFLNLFFMAIFLLFWSTCLLAQELDSELKLGESITPSNKEPLQINQALEEEEKNLFRFQGHFRHLIEGTKNTSINPKTLWVSENQLELGALFFSGPWKIESLLKQRFSFSNSPESPLYKLNWHSPNRNRLIPDIYDYLGSDYAYQASFSQIFLSLQTGRFFFSLGRQVKSWGEGRLLNPLNLISQPSTFSRDLEDIPGTDMAYLQYFTSSTTFIELVSAPYQRENNENPKNLKIEDTNILLRGKGSLDNTDLVLVAGRHFHSTLFGLETNLSLWDASWRLSYLARYNDEEKDWVSDPINPSTKESYWQHQGIIGFSYAFFKGRLRSNLEIFMSTHPLKTDKYLAASLESESFIQSGLLNPYPTDATFFATSGRVLTYSSYLLQGSLGFNLSPLMTLEIFGIWDPAGKSALLSPTLTYDLTDNTNWITTATFFAHSKDKIGEFSKGETRVFSYVKWYF